MKKLYLFFFILSGFPVLAQPSIDWNRTLGGSMFDEIVTTCVVPSGGFAVLGRSLSEISGDKTEACRGEMDYWVTRLAPDGTLLWQKTLGSSAIEMPRTIKPSSDGGLFVTGCSMGGISGDKTDANRGDYDFWIVKLNASGQQTWQRSMGGSEREFDIYVAPTADGGAYFAGTSSSGVSIDKSEASRGFYDYWVFKLDAQGQLIWEKTMGGSDFDYVNTIVLTANGGCRVGGTSKSGISGDRTVALNGTSDNWFVEFLPNGQVASQYAATYSLDEATLLSNGNYVSCGSRQYSLSEIGERVVIRNPAGAVVFQYDQPYAINLFSTAEFPVADPAGGFYYILMDVTAATYSLKKRDNQGNLLWTRPLQVSTTGDVGGSLVLAPDNSAVFSCYTYSNITADKTEPSRGYSDFWIVKFHPDNNLSTVADNKPSVVLSPVPVRDNLLVSNASGKGIVLMDANGKELWRSKISGESANIAFPYPNGTYFATFTDENSNRSQTVKIVK